MKNRAEAHRLLFQQEWEKIESEKKQILASKNQPVYTASPGRHQDTLTSSEDDLGSTMSYMQTPKMFASDKKYV